MLKPAANFLSDSSEIPILLGTEMPASPLPRPCRRRRLRPVVIDLRLDLRDSFSVACRFEEMSIAPLPLKVLLDRGEPMWDT